MQERVRQVVGKTNNGNLRIITLDKQPNNEIPSLASNEGQRLVEDQLKDSKFIILDSISTLFNIATNDEDNWLSIQNWFRRLRSQGYALMFQHHAGKSGLQRGASKSEDMLDISIKLSRPEDYRIEEGLRCVLEFDKTRGAAILDGEAIEVKMEIVNGSAVWTYRSTDDALQQLAVLMFKSGVNVYQVSKELKRPYSTIKYWHVQWKASQEKQKDVID
jgi:archaellum biogenesis ATPase FlaH